MKFVYSSTEDGISGAISAKGKFLCSLIEKAIVGCTVVAVVYLTGIMGLGVVSSVWLVWMLKDI